MDPLDLVSVVLRAAAFIAALQAAGLAWFATLCRRAGVAAVPSANALLRASALFAVALVLAHRALDAGRLAGEWPGVLDAHLQGMVWSRRSGLSSTVCAVGLLAVAVGAGRPLRWLTYVGSVGALCVAGSFALTGHTTEAARAGLLQGLLAVHVGIAAFWIGAVSGLHLLTRHSDPQAVARAAAQFSESAVWLVPLMLPAGGLLIWALLPNFGALLTPYGAFVLAKSLGFCGLIVLAAINRLRVLPAMLAGSSTAVLRFRRVLVAEWLLLASVLAATATMTSFFSWH